MKMQKKILKKGIKCEESPDAMVFYIQFFTPVNDRQFFVLKK